MRPAQPGEGIQEDDDVLAGLDEPLGPLDHQLGERDVLLGAPVEGRGVHLAPHRAPHVGDLLGAFVEQQHHEPGLGVVAGHGGGELLEQDGLAGLRRRDDQAALALADGGQEVDDASGESGRRVFHPQSLVRVQRGQVCEVPSAAGPFGRTAVHADDLGQGAPLAAHALDEVSPAQPVPADQRGGEGQVGGLGQQALAPQVPLAARLDVEDTARGLGRGLLYRGVFECGGHGGRSFRGHGHGACGRKGGAARGRNDTPPGGGNSTSNPAGTKALLTRSC